MCLARSSPRVLALKLAMVTTGSLGSRYQVIPALLGLPVLTCSPQHETSWVILGAPHPLPPIPPPKPKSWPSAVCPSEHLLHPAPPYLFPCQPHHLSHKLHQLPRAEKGRGYRAGSQAGGHIHLGNPALPLPEVDVRRHEGSQPRLYQVLVEKHHGTKF